MTASTYGVRRTHRTAKRETQPKRTMQARRRTGAMHQGMTPLIKVGPHRDRRAPAPRSNGKGTISSRGDPNGNPKRPLTCKAGIECDHSSFRPRRSLFRSAANFCRFLVHHCAGDAPIGIFLDYRPGQSHWEFHHESTARAPITNSLIHRFPPSPLSAVLRNLARIPLWRTTQLSRIPRSPHHALATLRLLRRTLPG